jgi:hypothetical protein
MFMCIVDVKTDLGLPCVNRLHICFHNVQQDGLDSKNNKTKVVCVEEIGFMIDAEGPILYRMNRQVCELVRFCSEKLLHAIACKHCSVPQHCKQCPVSHCV